MPNEFHLGSPVLWRCFQIQVLLNGIFWIFIHFSVWKMKCARLHFSNQNVKIKKFAKLWKRANFQFIKTWHLWEWTRQQCLFCPLWLGILKMISRSPFIFPSLILVSALCSLAVRFKLNARWALSDRTEVIITKLELSPLEMWNMKTARVLHASSSPPVSSSGCFFVQTEIFALVRIQWLCSSGYVQTFCLMSFFGRRKVFLLKLPLKASELLLLSSFSFAHSTFAEQFRMTRAAQPRPVFRCGSSCRVAKVKLTDAGWSHF